MILSRLPLHAFSAIARVTLLSALLLMILPSVAKILKTYNTLLPVWVSSVTLKFTRTAFRVSFLGSAVDHGRVARALSISCPSCIPGLLPCLDIPSLRTCRSPCVHVPPNFGSRDPQVANIDASAPASKEELAALQIIIGSISCYARAICGCCHAHCCLSSCFTTTCPCCQHHGCCSPPPWTCQAPS